MTYEVNIPLSGTCTIVVEAESEEDAQDMALDIFHDLDKNDPQMDIAPLGMVVCKSMEGDE